MASRPRPTHALTHISSRNHQPSVPSTTCTHETIGISKKLSTGLSSREKYCSTASDASFANQDLKTNGSTCQPKRSRSTSLSLFPSSHHTSRHEHLYIYLHQTRTFLLQLDFYQKCKSPWRTDSGGKSATTLTSQFTAGFARVPDGDRSIPPQDAPCLVSRRSHVCLHAGSLAGLLAGLLVSRPPEGHPSLPLDSPDLFLRCDDSNWWGRGGGGDKLFGQQRRPHHQQ